MNKSHVSMEQHVCVVCGKTYDTGSILLDRRLKNSMETNTVTGYGACPEHQELADNGYVALVASTDINSSTQTMASANRTGELAHIKQKAFKQIFNIKLDPKKFPMVFVEPEVIERLKLMMNQSEGGIQ